MRGCGNHNLPLFCQKSCKCRLFYKKNVTFAHSFYSQTVKLSIIIPVYDVRPYLGECMKSVFSQQVDDFEVLLVDDGSTDGSGALCDTYAADHPQVRVIHQPHQGLSAARNAGLARATGDFIAFLDADDRVGSGTWGDNLKFFSIYPDIDMVEFPIREHEGSPRENLLDFSPRHVSKAVFNDWIIQQGYEHCYVCNKLYRARLWQSRRFPVGQVFEDTAVMPSIIRDCRAVFYSAKGCYHYMSRPGSISNSWHYAACRQLYLNSRRLLSECASSAALTRHLAPLRRACMNRLVDMGRCRDCDRADFRRQLSRLPTMKRLICQLRVLRSSKL